MEQNKHDAICETYWNLWNRGQSDPEYARLLGELVALDPEYRDILDTLPEQHCFTIDRYIALRENLNRRMLEYACAELRRPDRQEP